MALCGNPRLVSFHGGEHARILPRRRRQAGIRSILDRAHAIEVLVVFGVGHAAIFARYACQMPYRATPDAAELWLRIIAAIGMLGCRPVRRGTPDYSWSPVPASSPQKPHGVGFVELHAASRRQAAMMNVRSISVLPRM
jgi:hypothetical protein